MIKTYPEFIDVIKSKNELYAKIPEGHLTLEGKNVSALYKSLEFDACLCSNANDLLSLMEYNKDIEFLTGVEYELRKIRRCLERLVDAENKKENANA